MSASRFRQTLTILTLLVITILYTPALLAQSGFTSVTATVTDSNGTKWVNAPYTVTFFDPGTSGRLPLLNGSTFQQSFNGINTTSSGTLSISLPDNSVIASTSGATGTQWRFSICTAVGAYTTVYCIPPTLITISGASQDISATLTAVSPLLPSPGIGGTVSANQIAFGTAANILGSSPNLTYTNSTSTLNLTGSTIGSNAIIKGPIPWRDIESFGARPVAFPPPSATTAACNSNTTITMSSSPAFVNGDGVVIYGCGPANTMSTPTAPTVTSGNSQTLTVPESVLSANTGATTYNYILVGHDKAGGLTLPSPVGTTTTGLASLGQQTFTVTSESLTGSSLTVVTSATNNLTTNTLVHIKNSNNAALSGWFNVSTITNGTTFVVNNLPIYSATTVASTGGTLTYFTGNKLTWTAAAGVWEYYICASRPADSGAYHVIGVSYPASTNGNGSLSYTDWGSTLSSAPSLPTYNSVSIDSACTAVAATPDYLSTTIVSGAGTTSLTVANAASQTSSGKIIQFDDAPAILAAANAAHAGATSGNSSIFIPPDLSPSGGGYFVVSSYLNLATGGLSGVNIHQQGQLLVYDTIETPSHWQGDIITGQSVNQFQFDSVPIVGCQTAWPCTYVEVGASTDIEYLAFNGSAQNQSLQMILDGTTGGPGGRLRHLVFQSGAGGASDFSGISLLVRPSGFLIDFDSLSFLPGPGQSFTDQTWTPNMWLMHSISGIGATQLFRINNISGSGRGIYATSFGQSLGPNEAHNIYIQGAIMPSLTLQNLSGNISIPIDASLIHNDTSPQPLLAILGGGGAANVSVTFRESNTGSNETGGVPPFITGVAPSRLLSMNNSVATTRIGGIISPITYVNAETIDSAQYYANDASDSNNFAKLRGIQTSSWPLSTTSGSFIPLATPIQTGAIVVSAGGTDIIGTNTYCVSAIGWNGGWSNASCQQATTTTGNQTVQINWSAVSNVQGYVVMEFIAGGQKCIPAANSNCTGISTTATTLTYTGGAGCCTSLVSPTVSGDGAQGYNSSGLFGSQLQLFNGLFKGTEVRGTLTANRTYTWPDTTGNVVIGSNISGVVVMDGVKYPYTVTGIQNCINDAQLAANAGICDGRGIPTGTTIAFGSTTVTDNSKNVILRVPMGVKVTGTATGGMFNFKGAGSSIIGEHCDIWNPPDSLTQPACFYILYTGTGTAIVEGCQSTCANTGQRYENLEIDVTGSGAAAQGIYAYGGQFSTFRNIFLKGFTATKYGICFSGLNPATPVCATGTGANPGVQNPIFEFIHDDSVGAGSGAIIRVEGLDTSHKVVGGIMRSVHLGGGTNVSGNAALQLVNTSEMGIYDYINDNLVSASLPFCITLNNASDTHIQGMDCEGNASATNTFFDLVGSGNTGLTVTGLNGNGCTGCTLWANAATIPSNGIITGASIPTSTAFGTGPGTILIGQQTFASGATNGLFGVDAGGTQRAVALTGVGTGMRIGDPGIPLEYNSNLLFPTTAGTNLGRAANPIGTLFIGTAATNNFAFTPPATAAARVINWTDPLATANLPFTNNTSTTTTQVVHATATAGLYTTAAIASGDLPATAVQTGQTNVYGAFLQDFTSATMEIPEAAGFTTNANSTIGLDLTANITHLWTNNADSLAAATTSTSTTTTQPLFATAVAGIYNPRAIATGDLPAAVVLNNATNTGTAAMTLNMSASTGATAFQVPVIAGATAGANGVIDYDSTNLNTHIRTNNADSIAVAEAAALAANTIPKATNATTGLLTASLATDNGTTLNYTGTGGLTSTGLTMTNLLISKTAPTITGAGCGGSGATISANNGTGAFSIGTGTTPGSACTVTMPTATTGWVCDANTVSATTTTNYIVKQTGAVSTTSVVLTLFTDAAATQSYTGSDTIRVKCSAY